MSDEASAIAKEAKGLQQGLKEFLTANSRDPWDKEVEFQRKNLQKQYLFLLLAHPYAKESKDAETHLWMQTSYALISVYKQRITTVERALRESGAQKQQGRGPRHGPVEQRKLLQRFKQFLANEEKFWTQLVVRYQRQFALTEARPALLALGILSPTEAATDEPDVADDAAGGRQSHFRFPPEGDAPEPPPTQTQRASRLTTLSKALICLGDLARYREQYSEGSGRPREDGGRRGGRNRRQNAAERKEKDKDYYKAKGCYERARDLVPDEGNASHQLAILASYQRDTFESLVNYYRALCARVSYDPAAENMGTVLTKVLESWKGKVRARIVPEESADEAGSGRARYRAFRERVVLIHALWRLSPEEMDRLFPNHAEQVLHDFSHLVSERSLPIDTITKVFVLAEGALWKHRMVRAPSATNLRRSGAAVSTVSLAAVESRIATHIVALHHALIKCAEAQLDESARIAEDDLAMRITATLRRMLPALRVAGKWLLRNMDYVFSNSLGARSSDTEKPVVQISGVQALFDAHTVFALRLSSIFPPDDLPKLTRPLEEDMDLQGFLPLRGPLNEAQVGQQFDNGIGSQVFDSDIARSLEQVHPNEEQLMRIWDIWHNASTLAELRGSPIKAVAPPSTRVDQRNGDGNVRVQRGAEAAPTLSGSSDWSARRRWSKGRVPMEVEEDAQTEVTRTDDDPVGDAFRQALSISDEGEDDEIVWDPRAQTSPPGQPAAPAQHLAHIRTGPGISPTSPLSPVKASPAYSPTSPIHQTSTTISPISRPTSGPAPLISPKTTAQDLLNNVMAPKQVLPGSHPGPRIPAHRGHLAQPSFNVPLTPQHAGSSLPPQLLFGGAQTGSGAVHSIWAAGPGEGSLLQHHHQPSGSMPLSPPPAGVHTSSQSMSQASWPSSFNQSIQAAHPQHFSTPPMDTFALAPGQSAHRRVPSAALPMSLNYLAASRNESASYIPYAQSPAGFNPHVPFSRNGMGVDSAPGLSSDMYSDPAVATIAGQPPQLPYSHPNQHHAFNTFDMPGYPGDQQQNVGGLWGRVG